MISGAFLVVSFSKGQQSHKAHTVNKKKQVLLNLSFCDPEFSQEFPPGTLSLEDQWEVSIQTHAVSPPHLHSLG